MQAVRRLQRHNRGSEIRVPPDVRRELQARTGDYLLFDWNPGDLEIKLSRVPIGESKDGDTKKE